MTRHNVGDRVAQAQYGTGTVTAVNEFHTIIDFDEHGLRTFSTNRVQLDHSTSLAPVRPAARTPKRRAPRQPSR